MLPDLLRVLATADEASDGADMGKLIGEFAQYGPIGVVIVLLIIGVLVPKYVMSALMAEKDNWRLAFEKEREAHQATREQLAKAEERGDVAVEQGKAMTRLLEEFGHRPQTASGSA
ncbi:hypothetical protein AB0B92_13730 [Streptomyces hygroscopicus]|uniref:hypothetical protein n=1 Tax=Streptomyces hygroscopicus TaxID=1912 RepID=UPI0033CB25D0